jgi:hypothetical protein
MARYTAGENVSVGDFVRLSDTGHIADLVVRCSGLDPRCVGVAAENALSGQSFAVQPIERLDLAVAAAEPQPTDPLLQFFVYEHLPPALQGTSQPFCDLARRVVAEWPRNAERTVTLRKLLEAKDAAVRSRISVP